MSVITHLQVPQDEETLLTNVNGPGIAYRYAYARSADSRANGDPGQDFVAIRSGDNRIVFAVCDGVSQSFMGEMAARHLGLALVDWLWENAAAGDTDDLRSALASRLDALTAEVSKEVQDYSLPAGLPTLLCQVLEQKRLLGSESMFVTGSIDLDEGFLVLAWMGDSRLRLWGPEGEVTGQLGEAFHTRERWSSLRGPVGELHVFQAQLSTVRRIVVYTDGLAVLDGELASIVCDAQIQARIDQAGKSPDSDDISYIEALLDGARFVDPYEKGASGGESDCHRLPHRSG